MDGVLVVRNRAVQGGSSRLPADREACRGLKLEVRDSADGVEGVKRGFAEFDLVLRVRPTRRTLSARIQKEIEQIEKADRQLRAPTGG